MQLPLNSLQFLNCLQVAGKLLPRFPRPNGHIDQWRLEVPSWYIESPRVSSLMMQIALTSEPGHGTSQQAWCHKFHDGMVGRYPGKSDACFHPTFEGKGVEFGVGGAPPKPGTNSKTCVTPAHALTSGGCPANQRHSRRLSVNLLMVVVSE